MPRNQDDATERLGLKRKAMEPVGKTKFMRSFIKHEAKINEVLLEVMTESSEERDICNEGDKDLLNEHEDDDEIYEMQESNICNMAMSDPKGVENKGWTGTEEDYKQWTEIDIDDTIESDNTDTSKCMSTLLSQGAQGSVKLLRKSLNCLLKQNDSQDVYKDHKNQKQKITPPEIADYKKVLEPILEERLVSLRCLTMTLNILKLKKYVDAHKIMKSI